MHGTPSGPPSPMPWSPCASRCRPGSSALMAVAPSASYSLTVRLEITNRPGMLGRVASAIGDAGGDIGAVDLVEMTDGIASCATSPSRPATAATARTSSIGSRRVAGVRVVNISDRTFLMHLGGKIEIHSKVPDPHARRPLHGLHARRGPGLPGHQGGPAARLHPDHQAEHRGRRHRRHRGARPGRHRARGGHAGDGRQGHALQGVRRRRRLPDLPGHQGPRQDRGDGQASSRPPSAASTSRTSRRRAASRSRSGCARSSTSPSSTTTSTAPPWWCWPRC